MQTEPKTLCISVIWRGNNFIVEADSGSTLLDFGKQLQKLSNVKANTMRLIIPESSSKSLKLLSPFSDGHSFLSLREICIPEGKSIRMMGVPKNEIDEVLQDAKANLRIAGFDEEEIRLRRLQDKTSASLKLPQGIYVFCDFRTLELPGIELNPPASEALKRMHLLASDPGIVAIMNKHHWRVGIMTEMAPVGYVGMSPNCILGCNKNHGEEISLRLRTDDLKGFRKFESIKQTMLHELAHMIYSEHDANFFALNKLLNEESAALDWTKSRSHTLIKTRKFELGERENFLECPSDIYHRVGGNSTDQPASARVASVLAAYSRSVNCNPINNSKLTEEHYEPDPDDSGFNTVDGCGYVNPRSNGEAILENTDKDRIKPFHVTDPDDEFLGNQIELKCEDGLRVHEYMECEDYSGVDLRTFKSESESIDVQTVQNDLAAADRVFEEPDPDDSLKLAQSDLVDSQITMDHGSNVQAMDEPDPDDSETEQINLKHGEDGFESSNGPIVDQDDSGLQRIQESVTLICNRLQKAIEMLQSEVTPTQISTVIQTLFKIIRNLVDHPEEMKFKRLRMANPVFQKNVGNYKAAREVLSLAGFIEDVLLNEIGKMERYMVLKRNDPALLWILRSSLEACDGAH